MIICGSEWQPTEVLRVIEIFPTSTRVAKVMTDAGVAFLKGMGNPAGNESLASELVGSELAAHLGLTLPPFAVMDLHGLEVPRTDGGRVQFGPAFLSRELTGTPATAGEVFLAKLVNPDDVARLVVFDTWVRNLDRCPPSDYIDPTPRRDNLLFTPVGRKFRLVALDHTHCFVEEDLESGLASPQFVEDDGIYGLFPEFRPFIGDSAVRSSVEALRSVDGSAVEEIVHSVPEEWGPTPAIRTLWAEKIVARRDRVADRISAALVHQRELGFEE